MAIYIDYHMLRVKYFEAQAVCDEILSEKEKLFAKTQPKSIQFDNERVSGGTPTNPFDEYLITLEKKRIDQRLSEAKALMEERQSLLMIKEADLRQSSEIHDRIYCLRVLDRCKLQKILMATHYSRSQVYRILKEIYENIKLEGIKANLGTK